MPDSSQLRIDYLTDICSALSEYVRGGGDLQIESDMRPDDVLSIVFTLNAGSQFHRLLRETMSRRLP